MKRFSFNRQTAVAAIFLAMLIFLGGINGLYYAKHAYTDLKSGMDLKATAEELSSLDFYFFDDFLNLYSLTQGALNAHLIDDSTYGFIIKDYQGKLHFPRSVYDTRPYADSVATLSENANAPVLFVLAPGKVIEGYTVLPTGGYNYANDNADLFLKTLTTDGLPFLDLRTSIATSSLPESQWFYNTDHHWTTKAAFTAFGDLVSYLNENYGLGIDPDGYYTDSAHYIVTEYPDSFLGSLGRRVGPFVAGVDDYTLIEPNFETDYTVTSETESLTLNGSFREAILHPDLLKTDDIMLNKHAAYFGMDYGNLVIHNNLADNDIKILLVKDSYSLPLAAFLSTAVEEVHMLDVRDEKAPIVETYLNQRQFDIVIICYNADALSETMFNFDH
jgi:hypothetical protein